MPEVAGSENESISLLQQIKNYKKFESIHNHLECFNKNEDLEDTIVNIICMKTNQHSSSVVSSRISFSQHSMRFELPVDLWLLKDMSPTQYLSTYCRCDDDLSMLYKAVFSQKDRDKDGLINLKEMEHALLLVYKLNERHIERLYTLTKVNEDFKVDLKLFIALGCLMSRILDKEPIDDAVKPNIIIVKDLLEKADFYALKWRASDVGIGGDLWNLLSYLF